MKEIVKKANYLCLYLFKITNQSFKRYHFLSFYYKVEHFILTDVYFIIAVKLFLILQFRKKATFSSKTVFKN